MKKHFVKLFILANLIFMGAFVSGPQGYGINQSSFQLSKVDDFAGGAYLTFAGKFGGELKPSDVKACSEVAVRGCANGSKVFQFTLSIIKSGKSQKFNGKSYQLSGEILAELRSLSAGDEFQFDNIKAHLPTGEEVDVVARKFVIV